MNNLNLIGPRLHGTIDYLAAALLFLAPKLFGFEGTQAATISYAVGTMHLLLTLVTAYPMGLIRAVPFTVHGWIECAAAIGLAAMPWLANFAYDLPARNFFVGSGLGILAVWALSDYKSESPVRSWAVHHGLARG